MTHNDDVLSLTEAAAYLGVVRQTVHNLTKQGYGRRIGNMWVFTRAELDQWKAAPRHAGGRPRKTKTTSSTAVNQSATASPTDTDVVPE